jgi:hypothetical protein
MMKVVTVSLLALTLALGLAHAAGALDLDTLQAMKKQAEKYGPPDITDFSVAKRLCLCELDAGRQMLGFLVNRTLEAGSIVALDCAVPSYNPVTGEFLVVGACSGRGGVRWTVLPK